MNWELVMSHRRGVVCIFCSTRTPLPVSLFDPKRWDAFGDLHSGLLVARCESCGKEAQYTPGEIIAIQTAAAGV